MKNKIGVTYNWEEQFEDMVNLSGTWWISREVANPRRMKKLIEKAISENSVNKKEILHRLFQFKRMGAISYEAWSVLSEMIDSKSKHWHEFEKQDGERIMTDDGRYICKCGATYFPNTGWSKNESKRSVQCPSCKANFGDGHDCDNCAFCGTD